MFFNQNGKSNHVVSMMRDLVKVALLYPFGFNICIIYFQVNWMRIITDH